MLVINLVHGEAVLTKYLGRKGLKYSLYDMTWNDYVLFLITHVN